MNCPRCGYQNHTGVAIVATHDKRTTLYCCGRCGLQYDSTWSSDPALQPGRLGTWVVVIDEDERTITIARPNGDHKEVMGPYPSLVALYEHLMYKAQSWFFDGTNVRG